MKSNTAYQTNVIETAPEISVSVVICTYGRGDMILTTLRSILNSGAAFNELIVVDQNEDQATYQAICPLLTDTRLKYVRSKLKGLSRARNMGIDTASSEVVAFTDDDCEVTPNWLEGYIRVFSMYSDVTICYGSVEPTEYDPALGYVPTYKIAANRYCRTLVEKLTAQGIGANFAVRRTAVQALGGFDIRLGAGGELYSGEDRDMTLRCLLAGHGVYECRESIVLHDGFRDWATGKKHTAKDWFGLGAAYIKPLRVGQWSGLPYLLHQFLHYALVPFLIAILTFRSQKGWTRISSFIAGCMHGWNIPVDPKSLCYATA